MAQIENLPVASIKDLEEKDKVQLILDVRFRRRQVKETRRKKAAAKKPTPKKSPMEMLKGMSDEEILKVMALIRGESNADS